MFEHQFLVHNLSLSLLILGVQTEHRRHVEPRLVDGRRSQRNRHFTLFQSPRQTFTDKTLNILY